MSKQIPVLHLRIEQDGKVTHHYLKGKDVFTIGRDPRNNLTLFGDDYPKQHPLFTPSGKIFLLHFPASADGEIQSRQSRLKLSDLVEHELLPGKNGFYTLPIKPGKLGYVFLGNTRIDFVIEAKAPAAAEQKVYFEGFSPWRVFLKHLQEDALFKGIVTVLMLLNIGLLFALKDYKPKPKPRKSLEERRARIVKLAITAPKIPEPKPTPVLPSNKTREDNAGKKDKSEKAEKPKNAKKSNATPKKKINPSNLGVLALIGASGPNKTNSSVERLLSSKLAADLSEVGKSQKLTIGSKSTGETDTDALLDFIGESGIDDLIGDDLGSTESISLSEKSTVSIDKLESVTGSKEALGARTEGSLRDVLQQNMGRLTYIYNRYLKQNPNFRGLMRVKVTIAPNGRVSNVELLSSNMGNSRFEQEILNAIKRFRYDPIASGSVEVIYPLSFYKQG